LLCLVGDHVYYLSFISYQCGFVKYTILLHLPIKTIDAHPCTTCERGWGNSKIEWKCCP
jgi:hypothetical protein